MEGPHMKGPCNVTPSCVVTCKPNGGK
jgi:hypothetical protein